MKRFLYDMGNSWVVFSPSLRQEGPVNILVGCRDGVIFMSLLYLSIYLLYIIGLYTGGKKHRITNLWPTKRDQNHLVSTALMVHRLQEDVFFENGVVLHLT